MDRLLRSLRSETTVDPETGFPSSNSRVTREAYNIEVDTMDLDHPSLGHNPADWTHSVAANKLFMVTRSYMGTDARRVVHSELSGLKDGLGDYRLLNREYDHAYDDLQATLLEQDFGCR